MLTRFEVEIFRATTKPLAFQQEIFNLTERKSCQRDESNIIIQIKDMGSSPKILVKRMFFYTSLRFRMEFDEIHVGQYVRYEVAVGDRGPVAQNVKVLLTPLEKKTIETR